MIKKLSTKTPKVFLKKIQWTTNKFPTLEETQQNKKKDKPETISTRPITRSRTKRQPVILGTTEQSNAEGKRLGGQYRIGRTRKETKKSWKTPELEKAETWDRKLPETISKALRIAFIMSLLSTVPPVVESRPFDLGLENFPVNSDLLSPPGNTNLGENIVKNIIKNKVKNTGETTKGKVQVQGVKNKPNNSINTPYRNPSHLPDKASIHTS